MIQLAFVSGSRLRRVLIKGRKISMMTPENNYEPLTIDLDRLEDKETKRVIKESMVDDQTIKDLSRLKTEKELAKDVTKDFQSSGWRLFKRLEDGTS